MSAGIIGLHSLLRWLILFFLIINVVRVFVEGEEAFDQADKRWSLRLLILVYINFFIGIVQYTFGQKGIYLINEYGWDYVMKYDDLRFWAVIHPLCMLASVIFISLAHRVASLKIIVKKKHQTMLIFWFIAFILMMYAIPWPFRGEEIGRPYFRGLSMIYKTVDVFHKLISC